MYSIWFFKESRVICLWIRLQCYAVWMWFSKKNRITRIVYVWFTPHFACRIEKKCFLSIILWYVYVYLIIFNSDSSSNSLLWFLFLHDFQINTEYVILKANYCLSAPLKVKTTPMPGHKSNAPVGMAIAISTGNFPSDSILKNASSTVKQFEH